MSMRAAKGKKRPVIVAAVSLLLVLLALPVGAALPRSADVAELPMVASSVAHIAPAPALVPTSILPATSAITPRAGPARARLRVHIAPPPSWPFSPARVGAFGRLEAKNRVWGFRFGLSGQRQWNQWFNRGIAEGVHNGPSQYQFAGYSPANYSDPLGLYIVGSVHELFVLKETLRKAGASDLARSLRLERREIPERFGGSSRRPSEDRIAIVDRSFDWTQHSNEIARLIAKAIETEVRIEFSLTSKDLSKMSGAVTKSRDQLAIPYFDPTRSDDENFITIELNPEQIQDARVPSFNAQMKQDVRIPVPLEAAVVHELGHAFWMYGLRNTAPTAFDKSGTNKEAVDWENVYRKYLGLALRSWH